MSTASIVAALAGILAFFLGGLLLFLGFFEVGIRCAGVGFGLAFLSEVALFWHRIRAPHRARVRLRGVRPYTLLAAPLVFGAAFTATGVYAEFFNPYTRATPDPLWTLSFGIALLALGAVGLLPRAKERPEGAIGMIVPKNTTIEPQDNV